MIRTDLSRDVLRHVDTVAAQVVKDARARMGRGWDLLSPELRDAMVCREVVGVLLAQVDGGEALAALQQVAAAARRAVDPSAVGVLTERGRRIAGRPTCSTPGWRRRTPRGGPRGASA